jgi:hypothetical protein
MSSLYKEQVYRLNATQGVTSSLSLSTSTTSSFSPDVPTTPSGSHCRCFIVSDINKHWPKKGDKDYIKWPENAFIFFRRKCCEDRNLAQGARDAGDSDGSSTKKLRQANLSKMISQQWKCLSSEEHQYWVDLAKEKKVRTFSLSSIPFCYILCRVWSIDLFFVQQRHSVSKSNCRSITQ